MRPIPKGYATVTWRDLPPAVYYFTRAVARLVAIWFRMVIDKALEGEGARRW